MAAHIETDRAIQFLGRGGTNAHRLGDRLGIHSLYPVHVFEHAITAVLLQQVGNLRREGGSAFGLVWRNGIFQAGDFGLRRVANQQFIAYQAWQAVLEHHDFNLVGAFFFRSCRKRRVDAEQAEAEDGQYRCAHRDVLLTERHYSTEFGC